MSGDVEENAYFDDYAARGYLIKVYQTSHMDFCANEKVSSCMEFDSYNPVWLFANKSYQDENAGTFSAVMARTFDLLRILLHGHVKNYTGRLLAQLISEVPLVRTPRGQTRPLARFDVPSFPNWFDSFADDVMRSDRGTLFFTHFMVPHEPYLLTSTCNIRELTETHESDYRNREHYYAQVRCIFLKLEELLERIDRSERHRDALIIVQGDHGSRISVDMDRDEIFTEGDFVNNYGTFFVVRAPDRSVAGHDCELASLSDLFVRYARYTNGRATEARGHKPFLFY